MIKAVIFDLDDTLYNAEFCYARGQDKLADFVREKYEEDQQTFDRKYLEAKKIVKKRLKEVASCHNRLLYIQTYQELSGRGSFKDVMTMYDLYWNTVIEQMSLFSFVMPLMKSLQMAGIKIGILTDLTSHIQHRKILKLGLSDYINAFVTSEEAGCEKPSIDMFNLILQKLDIKPTEALMIGDNLEKDIVGAKKIGMDYILYDRQADIVHLVLEKIGKDILTNGNAI